MKVFPLLICLVLAGAAMGLGGKAGSSMPNVVFVLADDIGWADPGRYHESYAGGTAPVPTPNLNRLCDEGMIFTDAQLPAALCAPNRFCLLTGSLTHRSRPWGTWNRTQSTGFEYANAEGDRSGNPHRTVGTVLQEAGYRTAFIGKMHTGGDFFDANGTLLRSIENDQLGQIDFSRRFEDGLLEHGFDYTFVTPDGIQGPLYAYFENDLYRPISDFAERVEGVDVGAPSVLRDFAKDEVVGNGVMIEAGYGDSEFDTSEHGPILTHFARRFMVDHVASHPDKPFMLYYATPAIHLPLTPSVNGIEALGATGIGRRADFVFDFDSQLGLLLDELEVLGVADNTLVIVTSDNGGATGGGQAQIDAGQDPNGPLRGKKTSVYEGGHRVPFIWKWGDGTEGGSVIRPGRVCTHLVSGMDWVTSMVDLAGGRVAEDQHYDSVSLLPLVFSPDPDGEAAVRRFHYYHVEDFRAVRMDDGEGKWFYKRTNGGGVIELYDLATDLGQENNLVEGFATLGDLPVDHPHRMRLETMDAWFLNHNATNKARTEPARNYTAPAAGEIGRHSVSVSLTNGAQAVDVSAGPYGVEPSSVWTNSNVGVMNLPDEGGLKTTLDFRLTAPAGRNFFGAPYQGTPLHTGLQYFAATASPVRVTLSEIPYTTYDVIVYLTGFIANTGASVTDGTETYFWQTANPHDATLTETTNTSGLDIPVANYAVFRDLSGPTQTLTFEHISGGGAGVGGFQVVGEGPAGMSAKTAIPVPVVPPALRLDHDAALLSASGLQEGLVYQLECDEDLAGVWTVVGGFTAEEEGVWSGPAEVNAPQKFFRLRYPERVGKFALPLSDAK